MELCIKENKKELLRKEFGKIHKENFVEAVKELKKQKKKICVVGDYCTKLLIENEIVPEIAVIDGKTMRESIRKEEIEEIEKRYLNKIYLKNRRGCISEASLWIGEIGKKLEGFLIVVEGEEDLVALPLILNKDENSIVIYGLWNKGAVFVENREEVKKVWKELF